MSLWQRMPPHLIESQILISGGAFKMKYQFGSEEPKPRLFFVLKSPVRDDYLFMVTATTEIRRRKKRFRHDREALVIITPSEYNALKQTSLFDCGSPIHNVRKAEVIARISKYEVQPLPQLPDHLLERLRNAVSRSKRLTSNQKRLVLGDEESVGPSYPN
jgi:hypothetical protein